MIDFLCQFLVTVVLVLLGLKYSIDWFDLDEHPHMLWVILIFLSVIVSIVVHRVFKGC